MLGSSMARSRAAGGGGGGGRGTRRGSGAGRADAGRALAEVPLCRVLDGDHLHGRWVQNCDPQTINRPDRYAYGRTLPGSPGNWDYRQCFKMSYEERERSRAALSWSWQPTSCQLPGGRRRFLRVARPAHAAAMGRLADWPAVLLACIYAG